MDVAVEAGISQATVSRFERGHLSALSLQTIRAILAVLEIRLSLAPTWRGSDLERLLDEDHATLVAAVTRILEGRGWTVLVEVTYSRYGERGSIDVLAARRDIRAILVVEVKTQLVSVELVIRRLDAKVRLAPHIAAERLGWRPAAVGRLLVLPESTTERRRWARHSVVLARSFPVSGGRAVREWLRRPVDGFAAVWFLSSSHRRTARRIRRVGSPLVGASPRTNERDSGLESPVGAA